MSDKLNQLVACNGVVCYGPIVYNIYSNILWFKLYHDLRDSEG